MDYQQLANLVEAARPELQRFGVSALHVFGSVARNQAGPESDVDLLVDFTAPPTFDRFMQLKFFLEDRLQSRVDLLTRPALRPEIRPFIEEDARRVA